tara:strand:- start:152 stop:799 length:648 start_codon:yes stop_codon:yes gene_type:complete
MIDDTPVHPWHKLRNAEYKKAIEKKGKFDYLSWAICLDKAKQVDPTVKYELVKIIDCGQSKIVHVELSYNNIDVHDNPDYYRLYHNEYLAVRGFRNEALASPDAAQVENTFRRCVAKAISMCFGFGIELWINEDLKDLDYMPENINGNTPVKGNMTVSQSVKLDRMSRSNFLTEPEQNRVKQLKHKFDLTEVEVDKKIAAIQSSIDINKLKKKGK